MFDNFLIHTFHDGNCLQAYKIFGAHFETHEGKKGVRFTTYAPNARSAQVVGEFNQWGETPCYMERYNNGGIYTIFVEGVKEFDMYKFRFETPQGDIIDKADPYAYFSELRPGTASKVYNMEGYRWHDSKWIKNRTKNYDCPLNIYEASLGSWKMKRESEGEGDDGEYYSYEELIDEIIPYVKKMGYTHLEVMPLTEFPFDGSWGYQATGFYSATSRYGQPKQLMKFIDACHQEGIGVIMDFVPAHFVKDSHGLHMYDGGFVYDYNDYNRRYSPWDSVYFDLGKNEVRSFLLSSVEFFATYYHIDGFRFDAVSNLIYYEGNKNLGENIGAMEWMKRLNGHMSGYHPTVMMIAEDSTDYPGVTKPVGEHGLGFDYKWDLGWMNDTLKYFQEDPVYRQYDSHFITFSMAYFYSERFLLEFSHDEVVHGIPGKRKLKNGDIITLDIGACYKGYHGDSAWTYPVGKISPAKEKLLHDTEESLFVGLSTIKEGAHVGDIGYAIEQYAHKHNLGVVEELCGHGVGTAVHEDPDVPNFGIKGSGPVLKAGMVIAVEPMLNMGTPNIYMLDDDWTIITADGMPSAHFEHTVVVTKEGYTILTKR